MLTLQINTQYFMYNNVQLNSVCRQEKVAVCKFSEDGLICNVPMGCFNVEYFDITPKQLKYYKQALNYIDLYHEGSKTCIYYAIPYLLLYVIFNGCAPLSYCDPECTVSLIPDPKAIECIPEDAAGNISIPLYLMGDGSYYIGVDSVITIM